MNDERKSHWETVYSTKNSQSISWYQPHAKLSLAWITHAGVGPDGAIIDVGGGASDLLTAGYRNLTVLDLSGAALNVALQRLGSEAVKVNWRETDITTADFSGQSFDNWHDRAVFHFLTEASDRKAYIEQLHRAVKPGAHVIIATFSVDGPLRCSGLPVVQYSAATLQQELGPQFELIAQANERHTTPSGTEQQFIYCHFIKRN